MKYWLYSSIVALAIGASACSDRSDVDSVPAYTYEPSEVTGSTIVVGRQSYEPQELPESLSPSG